MSDPSAAPLLVSPHGRRGCLYGERVRVLRPPNARAVAPAARCTPQALDAAQQLTAALRARDYAAALAAAEAACALEPGNALADEARALLRAKLELGGLLQGCLCLAATRFELAPAARVPYANTAALSSRLHNSINTRLVPLTDAEPDEGEAPSEGGGEEGASGSKGGGSKDDRSSGGDSDSSSDSDESSSGSSSSSSSSDTSDESSDEQDAKAQVKDASSGGQQQARSAAPAAAAQGNAAAPAAVRLDPSSARLTAAARAALRRQLSAAAAAQAEQIGREHRAAEERRQLGEAQQAQAQAQALPLPEPDQPSAPALREPGWL